MCILGQMQASYFLSSYLRNYNFSSEAKLSACNDNTASLFKNTKSGQKGTEKVFARYIIFVICTSISTKN
jgi:hypothetical protein